MKTVVINTSIMAIVSRKRVVLVFFLTTVMQHTNCLNSNTNWWFSIHLNDIKKKCNDNGTTFFDNILESLKRLREISNTKYADIERKFWISHSNITLKYMLHKKCYNDPSIKTAILNVTNNVQLCLKSEERLKKSNKKLAMRKMFDAVCSMMELYIFFNAETECEEILRKEAAFNKCYAKFPNVWPSTSYWPIPLIHPNQICNERTQLRECQMEVVKDCISFTWYTHATFRSLLSKAWSSIFCNNML